jgi:hypothetical protein
VSPWAQNLCPSCPWPLPIGHTQFDCLQNHWMDVRS